LSNEYRDKIIDYLKKHDKALWSELQALGIPKATLYRTLERLIAAGIVKKEGRYYVLSDKAYVAIIPFYAAQICSLIKCRDVDALTKDLMSYGEVIELIEKIQTVVPEDLTKTIRSYNLVSFIESFFRDLYSHKGFFTIFLVEMTKLWKGFEILSKCDKIDLKECTRLKNLINTFSSSIEKILKLDEETLEKILRLDNVLRGHGYDGKIVISTLGSQREINMREIFIAIYQTPFNIDMLKVNSFVIKLAFNFYDTGCRSFGEKEIEELNNICEIIP
jgi:DNA-binding transcriptional ArsR family regulator